MRNHDIERIYMQQLRNLESAVYVLRRKKRECEEEIAYLKEPLENPEKPEKPQFDIKGFLADVIRDALLYGGIGSGCIIWFVLGGISFLIKYVGQIFFHSTNGFYRFMVWIWENILILGIVVAIFGVAFFLTKIIKRETKVYQDDMREYHEYQEYYTRKCKENITKRKQKAVLLGKRVQQLERIEGELRKGLALRNNLYSYDWIPVNYRNIRVVYYISDMVTTSEITIEEALKYYLLQEVNNKLDEVLRRLDEIIRNQNQMFIRQAILEAQNEKKIRQNETMIRQMAQIETNTEMASQYAKLAANYTEANAYFSWACYLSNNK